MLSTRWVYVLFALMVVAAVALSGCSDTTGCANCAPLDYESNPASAKYDFEDVDTLVDEGLLDLDRPIAEYLDWGAIMILEAASADGRALFDRLVPVIRAVIAAADQT